MRAASDTRGAAPNLRLRNTIDATPVAATMSTLISPIVSHARMSTSSTLTALAPCPHSYAASGMSTETGCELRAAAAKSPMTTRLTPTAAPMSARTALNPVA